MKKVLLLLLSCVALAQDKPKVDEVSKLRLVVAYQKAVLAQNAATNAQKVFNDSATAYQEVSKKAIAENHLPEGTTFNVNIDSGEVTVMEPPKPPEKPATKPAEAPKK